MSKNNYKIIDDPKLILFIRKNLSPAIRKQLGIKLFWFKKEVHIPYPNYSTVSFLFMTFLGSGFVVGGNTKIDVMEP